MFLFQSLFDHLPQFLDLATQFVDLALEFMHDVHDFMNRWVMFVVLRMMIVSVIIMSALRTGIW